ncbi:trypsin-like peptidase domain-containing protein [Sporosarcina luteola]|uniref:trypsin-like peptidase domain-containing protein n=1 Tax=Sporosarcina luteola TaxID=582850 RepID=UPI00203C8FE3|nr:trypsin-like peptidase domain-containing protein [Sporosarcina luteola]MCM3636588.1 trypsin-like peptidase domain-containing protein [Sporosarcina luteola]
MFCSECGFKNAKGVNFCGSCGKPIQKKSHTGWMLLVIFVCICVLGGVGYAFLQINKQEALQTSTLGDANEKDDPVEQPVRIIEREVTERPKNKPVEKEKTELIEETLPRVFTIVTTDGFGSGFLYAKGGYIVTNAHVVLGYTDVKVRNSVGREAPGKVIGISDTYDVALIRSDANKDINPLKTEVNETKVGTEVIALGSPNGLENSASVGYLTGTGRDIRDDFFYEKAYQIDVQVETGSSGGPLIDAKTGKVIGINSLLLEKNRRIGFSIPLYTMTYLFDDWIKSPMSDRQVASVFGVYDDYGTSHFYNEDSYNSDASEDDVEGYEGDVYFYEEWLQDFILEFRTVYEDALSNEDLYQIEHYLLPGGSAHKEFVDYFAEISGEGMHFDFIENVVTGVTIYEDYALVSTYETLNFRNKSGNEKYYVKEKNYEVVIHMDGTYRIRDVNNR